MIQYSPGRWSILFAFSLRGSVFPKSFILAAPTSMICMLMHLVLQDSRFANHLGAGDIGSTVLQGFTFILGFLVVFRSQQAYSRWWEGGTLLQQIRGEWFNAYSSLISFCSPKPEKQADVEKFQHQLVRLVSLMYSCALRKVSTVEDKSFELIDLDGLDPDGLVFMQNAHDPCEVVLQWMQRLIVDAHREGTVEIAPPILSRVFNQLGNGIVHLNNAQKITDFPIPFPLAQMITIMLLAQLVISTIMCATSVKTTYWAGLLCFLIIMAYWSINFIAVELEMPFGDDANDLPIYEMQRDLNLSLKSLLDPQASHGVKFRYVPVLHTRMTMKVHHLDSDLSIQVSRPSVALRNEGIIVDPASSMEELAVDPRDSRCKNDDAIRLDDVALSQKADGLQNGTHSDSQAQTIHSHSTCGIPLASSAASSSPLMHVLVTPYHQDGGSTSSSTPARTDESAHGPPYSDSCGHSSGVVPACTPLRSMPHSNQTNGSVRGTSGDKHDGMSQCSSRKSGPMLGSAQGPTMPLRNLQSRMTHQ